MMEGKVMRDIEIDHDQLKSKDQIMLIKKDILVRNNSSLVTNPNIFNLLKVKVLSKKILQLHHINV